MLHINQMPEVFLSYRQTSAPERQRVRAFAERLRSSCISVILDQFFLEDHPGGPNDGWDKWSSDCALHTRHVIIGSQSWFQCFDKTQPPGTGLGVACEADDIRHRVYEANGIVETIHVVLFDDADSKYISPKLRRYHRFHADRDFDDILILYAKQTAMDPHSPHDESPFAVSGFTQMLDQTAALQTLADSASAGPATTPLPSPTTSASSLRPEATHSSSPGPPGRSAAATAPPSSTPSLTFPSTVPDMTPLVVAFAEDLLASTIHVAHLKASAVRAFGDGDSEMPMAPMTRDSFSKQVRVSRQLRRGVNLLFIEKENCIPCRQVFARCGKGNALVIANFVGCRCLTISPGTKKLPFINPDNAHT